MVFIAWIIPPLASGVLADSFVSYGERRGGGGVYTREGGGICEVLPLQKGGAEKALAMLKGGNNTFGVVFMWLSCRFSHIEEGGGHEKFYPVLRGGGAQNVSDPRFSHFEPPPLLPVINGQSLRVWTWLCLGQLTRQSSRDLDQIAWYTFKQSKTVTGTLTTNARQTIIQSIWDCFFLCLSRREWVFTRGHMCHSSLLIRLKTGAMAWSSCSAWDEIMKGSKF